MYIEPNSKIYICANVPIDERFDNTYLFNSRSEQIYYINNYYIATFDKYSYQRIGRGYLKVEAKADDLYGANYMTFQNTAYGDKWFFAFIKSVDYINDNVTQINYEIDPVQTWMFDWTLGQCFVEREHSATDAIGDNLVPETINFGEYMYSYPVMSSTLNQNLIVLWCTCREDFANSGGYFGGGCFSGLYPVYKNSDDEYFDLNLAGAQRCMAWINDLQQRPLLTDAIKCAVIAPKFLYTMSTPLVEHFAKHQNLQRINRDGTTSNTHNNKCQCYPYNFLYVTNNHGKSAVYPYEYFGTPQGGIATDVYFQIYGDEMQNPSLLLTPVEYKGMQLNYDEAIELGGYPQVAFNVDAFMAWLAQSASTLGLTTLAGASYLASPYIPTNESLAGGSVENISNFSNVATQYMVMRTLASGVTAMLQPPQSRGTQGSSVQLANGIQTYLFINKHIRPEFATIVDDYFDMFGYACHRVKIPNISLRQSWNYVKTIGCEIGGNIPADDLAKLKNIFDNGIRFWHQNKIIGDYTQDNSIPTP